MTEWLNGNWPWLAPILAACAPFVLATLKAIAKRTTTTLDDDVIAALEEAAHESSLMRLSLVEPSPRAPMGKNPLARTWKSDRRPEDIRREHEASEGEQ